MKKGDLIWFNSANSKARAIILDVVVLRSTRLRDGLGVSKNMFADGDLAVKLFWLDPDEIKPSCYNLVSNPDGLGHVLSSAWAPTPEHKDKWYNARWFKLLSPS